MPRYQFQLFYLPIYMTIKILWELRWVNRHHVFTRKSVSLKTSLIALKFFLMLCRNDFITVTAVTQLFFQINHQEKPLNVFNTPFIITENLNVLHTCLSLKHMHASNSTVHIHTNTGRGFLFLRLNISMSSNFLQMK